MKEIYQKLSYLVQKNFLYKISMNFELRFLKFSSKKNSKMNISIFWSIESLIGAIYLDGGFISAKVHKVHRGPH